MSDQTITQTHTLPDGRIFRAMLDVFLPSPLNQTPFVKVQAVQVDENDNVLLNANGFPNVISPDPIPLNLTNLISGAEQALDGYVQMQQAFSPESLAQYPQRESLPTTDEGLVRIGDALYQWKIGIYSIVIQNVLANIPALAPADTMTPGDIRTLLGLA